MRAKYFYLASHAWDNFFQTSNFELLQFCNPLSHKYAQYLIWKSLQFLHGIASVESANSHTFMVFYIHSKYPQLCSAYYVGGWVLFFWLYIIFLKYPNIVRNSSICNVKSITKWAFHHDNIQQIFKKYQIIWPLHFSAVSTLYTLNLIFMKNKADPAVQSNAARKGCIILLSNAEQC